MYRHETPSLVASGGRPVEHIVWTWPEGMDLQTALRNLHDGKCWCGAEPMTRGLRWYQDAWACSKKHRHTWWEQFEFWPTVRYAVMNRDQHRCVQCGDGPGPDGGYVPYLLQVDHRVAICNGGDPWDRDNLQTLCNKCHKIKTADDRRMRAGQRRLDRLQLRPLEEFA